MKILCLGDLSLDTYTHLNQNFFGGCSLNVARNLFEILSLKEVSLYVPIGTDQNSRDARSYLENSLMEARIKIIEGDLPRQPIKIDESGERHLYDYHAGVLPEFTCEDLGGFFFNQFGLLAFPFYAQVENLAHSIFDLKLNTPKACDFGNLSDYDGELEFVSSYLPKLSYAQFSSDQPHEDREAFFLSESAKSDLIIADTHGKYGATIYKKGESLFQEAPQVLEVIDTTGAGDAFFAHFIFASFVLKKDWKESLSFACEGASKQIGHLGPGPA